MTEKEIIAGFLSKTLNLDTAGVAALYNADGSLRTESLDELITLDAERINRIKADTNTKVHDDGYKKAQKETLTKLENDFKEKTGFKSSKRGVELYLDYAASIQAQGGEVTEDTIKKHPLYIKLQDESQTAIETAKTESEKALNDFKSGIEKKEKFVQVSKKGIELFHGYKPILSKDPVKAKAQEELFIEKLQGYDYDIQGEKVVILKDGKVVEDNHSNRIKFEDLVKDITTRYFDIHNIDPKQMPANGKVDPKNQQGSKSTIEVPKTKEEYNKLISDSKIPVPERQQIKEQWEAKQGTPA